MASFKFSPLPRPEESDEELSRELTGMHISPPEEREAGAMFVFGAPQEPAAGAAAEMRQRVGRAQRIRGAAAHHSGRAAEVHQLVRLREVARGNARRAAAAAVQRRAAHGDTKGATGKGGKDEVQREETCSICQCEFTLAGDSGEGLVCPSSHFMCSECAGVFVSSVMSDLEASYPPRCSLCKGSIPTEAFERQLTSAQLGEYAVFVARQSLKEGEMIVACRSCEHYEIRTDDPVVWWCAACKEGECRVCKDSFGGAHNGMSAQNMASAHASAERHVTVCARLRGMKQRVDEALEKGQKMACPQCGLSGRKDDACLHMTCMKCAASWCYLCGLRVQDCDKEPPRPGREANDIYLHNRSWESNEKRCPMYLTQILDVDPDWLGEDWDPEEEGEEELEEHCLNHYHEWHTIKLLQEVMSDIGQASMEELWDHFASLRNSGFTLLKIMSTDTSVMIDRDGWEGEDEEESWEESDDEGDELESDYDDEYYDEERSDYESDDEGMAIALQRMQLEHPDEDSEDDDGPPGLVGDSRDDEGAPPGLAVGGSSDGEESPPGLLHESSSSSRDDDDDDAPPGLMSADTSESEDDRAPLRAAHRPVTLFPTLPPQSQLSAKVSLCLAVMAMGQIPDCRHSGFMPAVD